MTDRTEAMDNLIAQDADLLDAEGVKLYWYRQGKDDGVEQERGANKGDIGMGFATKLPQGEF